MKFRIRLGPFGGLYHIEVKDGWFFWRRIDAYLLPEDAQKALRKYRSGEYEV